MTGSSKATTKPEMQMALLKVLKALTTLPAQVIFYGSIILAIAATGGAQLPGVLGMLSTTIGMNLLSNMLERVVQGENVLDEEIQKVVQETIQTTGIENLLTSNEFQRVTAHVFRQFDLLKYAVQRGEINIAALLSEQFAEHKIMLEEMQIELTAISEKLDTLATREQGERIIKLIRQLHETQGIIGVLPDTDKVMNEIFKILSDEAKDGPRLFSIAPVNRSSLDPKEWLSTKYKVILWCEHSGLPLVVLNGEGDKRGVYELDLPREWVLQAAPYLKTISTALGLVFPILSSAYTNLLSSDDQYKFIEKQLSFSRDVFDAMLTDTDKSSIWTDKPDVLVLPHGVPQKAEGALLREFHAFLKAKDPSFGGLVRVMNKQNEFLWVHKRFASEY
ncbi:MAG: hypothetical protein IPP66_13580 [Anaerolineales bacterium]|nr:hypothetical protein [Anaerolineales bacterium]